jgi:hypothetical protein
MSQIEGIFITVAEGRWLVERLRTIGRADDVWLAARLEASLAYDSDVGPLDDNDRGVLVDALDGEVSPRLEQLRAVLLFD